MCAHCTSSDVSKLQPIWSCGVFFGLNFGHPIGHTTSRSGSGCSLRYFWRREISTWVDCGVRNVRPLKVRGVVGRALGTVRPSPAPGLAWGLAGGLEVRALVYLRRRCRRGLGRRRGRTGCSGWPSYAGPQARRKMLERTHGQPHWLFGVGHRSVVASVEVEDGSSVWSVGDSTEKLEDLKHPILSDRHVITEVAPGR